MKASIVEFETVQDLATLLQVQVIGYMETHFPIDLFKDVENLTPATLVTVLEIIYNSPAARNSREAKGVFSTLSSLSKKATSIVKITHSPIEFHRLEQMLYFAEKAKTLKDLIKILLNSDSIEEINQTELNLIAEITELFATSALLTTTDYNTKIAAKVGAKEWTLDGMKGGFSKSTFADNLTKEIINKYVPKLTEMQKDIQKSVRLILIKVGTARVASFDHALANTAEAQAKLDLLRDSYAQMALLLQNNAATRATKMTECAEDHEQHSQLHHVVTTDGIIAKLTHAILNNDSIRVKEFLTVQNANLKNKQGLSPLYLAIFGMELPYTLRKDISYEIVDLLLTSGADPNEDLTGLCNCSFLHAVIFQRTQNHNYPYGLRPEKQLNYKLIELLLRHGASVTEVPSDEPDYKLTIVEPNIPGLINDHKNPSKLNTLLREFKEQKAHTRP